MCINNKKSIAQGSVAIAHNLRIDQVFKTNRCVEEIQADINQDLNQTEIDISPKDKSSEIEFTIRRAPSPSFDNRPNRRLIK